MRRTKIAIIASIALSALTLQGCSREADIASRNLSEAADQFQVHRRIVFYNGITGEYLLEIAGKCALGNDDKPRQLSVTCKTESGQFRKHFLGLSDNVTYFAEQTDASAVSGANYHVTFRPQTIAPSVSISTK
jgi:hypothetical protein